MPEQLSFSEAEYNLKKRKTRREKFLEQMDALLPWKRLEKRIRAYYPKAGMGKKLFKEINNHLSKQDLSLKEGSIVDASIIAAPTSIKNKQGKRDEAMHQTKKGNEWYFGMKIHIGVDDALGLIRSLETTP